MFKNSVYNWGLRIILRLIFKAMDSGKGLRLKFKAVLKVNIYVNV